MDCYSLSVRLRVYALLGHQLITNQMVQMIDLSRAFFRDGAVVVETK